MKWNPIGIFSKKAKTEENEIEKTRELTERKRIQEIEKKRLEVLEKEKIQFENDFGEFQKNLKKIQVKTKSFETYKLDTQYRYRFYFSKKNDPNWKLSNHGFRIFFKDIAEINKDFHNIYQDLEKKIRSLSKEKKYKNLLNQYDEFLNTLKNTDSFLYELFRDLELENKFLKIQNNAFQEQITFSLILAQKFKILGGEIESAYERVSADYCDFKEGKDELKKVYELVETQKKMIEESNFQISALDKRLIELESELFAAKEENSKLEENKNTLKLTIEKLNEEIQSLKKQKKVSKEEKYEEKKQILLEEISKLKPEFGFYKINVKEFQKKMDNNLKEKDIKKIFKDLGIEEETIDNQKVYMISESEFEIVCQGN